jgi:hypothetical protein
MSKTKVLKPREAMKLAKSLGWDVQPVRMSGEIRYKSPDGLWYISQAPGRKNSVCAKLAKAIRVAIEKKREAAKAENKS